MSITGVPLGIGLRGVEAHQKRFILVGYDGKEHVAMVYDTLDKARQKIEAARNDERVSVVLISNDEVADAYGFWVHSVYWRGDRKFISGEYIGIICG